MPKLVGVSVLIEVLSFILMMIASDFKYRALFLLIGFIYFFYMNMRYRNWNARHRHETETKTRMFNLKKSDNLIRHEKGLTNSRMTGANNERLGNNNAVGAVFDVLSKF